MLHCICNLCSCIIILWRNCLLVYQTLYAGIFIILNGKIPYSRKAHSTPLSLEPHMLAVNLILGTWKKNLIYNYSMWLVWKQNLYLQLTHYLSVIHDGYIQVFVASYNNCCCYHFCMLRYFSLLLRFKITNFNAEDR